MTQDDFDWAGLARSMATILRNGAKGLDPFETPNPSSDPEILLKDALYRLGGFKALTHVVATTLEMVAKAEESNADAFKRNQ